MAELEDSDDKIRRNLVVVSSIVLISAWLDIPFSAILGKFFGSAHARTDSYRTWVVGLTALMYVTLRYKFSAQGEALRSALDREIHLCRRRKLHVLISNQANYYSRTRREPDVFQGKFCGYIETRIKELAESPNIEHWTRTQIDLEPSPSQMVEGVPSNPWEFPAYVSLRIVSLDGKHRSSTGGIAIAVKVVGRHRLFIAVATAIQAVAYSKASIQYLIPVIFALFAILTLAISVALAYATTGLPIKI